ncbi:DinB/UmuC family translesion DNA polymerase [Pseudomonas profundi]|uniref:DinB/UmuC family translesion DNA polymerase n=1 Tax=Pseudomonas profundi TaxID=1981513 RepID=UPI00123C72B6
MEPDTPSKKEICTSRSFGRRLYELTELQEAVTSYVTRAAEKMRGQNSFCKPMQVGIRTGMFNENEQKYSRAILCHIQLTTAG